MSELRPPPVFDCGACPTPCTESSSAVMNSVSQPADAARSALPVASMAVLHSTRPHVPSGRTAMTAVTRPSCVSTPAANEPNHTSPPAWRMALRNHSPFAAYGTLPVALRPASISFVKPTRFPK